MLSSGKYKMWVVKSVLERGRQNAAGNIVCIKSASTRKRNVFSRGCSGEERRHALLQAWSSADSWSFNCEGKLLKLTYVLQGASPCKSSNDRSVPQHHSQACKGDWFMSTHLLAPALRSPVIRRKEQCVPRLRCVKHRENILPVEANTVTRVVRREVRGRMCEYCSPCRGTRGGQLCSCLQDLSLL